MTETQHITTPKPKHIILVCGGRNFQDKEKLYQVLDNFHEAMCIDRLVHGAARGADTLAQSWAIDRQVNYIAYPADWNTHGRSAGAIRNRQMFDNELPNLVVAFPDAMSIGTWDMIKYAKSQGCMVSIHQWHKDEM